MGNGAGQRYPVAPTAWRCGAAGYRTPLDIILAPTQATLDELPLHIERRERKRDGTWGKPAAGPIDGGDARHLARPRGPVGAVPLARQLTLRAHRMDRGYGQDCGPLGPSYLKKSLVELMMPRLCATGRVRLRQAQVNVLPLCDPMSMPRP